MARQLNDPAQALFRQQACRRSARVTCTRAAKTLRTVLATIAAAWATGSAATPMGQPCAAAQDTALAVRSSQGRRTTVDDGLFPETDRWVDLSGRRFAIARLALGERQAKQQCGCSHQRATPGARPGGEAMRNAAQNQASAMPGMSKVSMRRGRTSWCRSMENRGALRRRPTHHLRMMFYSLGHGVDSFVGRGNNAPRKSPARLACRAPAAMLCRPPLFGRYAPSSLRPAKHCKTTGSRTYRRDIPLTKEMVSYDMFNAYTPLDYKRHEII